MILNLETDSQVMSFDSERFFCLLHYMSSDDDNTHEHLSCDYLQVSLCVVWNKADDMIVPNPASTLQPGIKSIVNHD